MIDLITDNLEAIRDLCRRYEIQKLDLFGSAATGDFNPETSDLAFIVDPGKYTDGTDFRYLDFISDLEELLGFRVQMISARSITNPYFRLSVDEQRMSLHEQTNRQAAA
jgi:predicted nucleotidyltransferase